MEWGDAVFEQLCGELDGSVVGSVDECVGGRWAEFAAGGGGVGRVGGRGLVSDVELWTDLCAFSPISLGNNTLCGPFADFPPTAAADQVET